MKASFLPAVTIALIGSLTLTSPVLLIADIDKTQKEIGDTTVAITTLKNWTPNTRQPLLSKDGVNMGFSREQTFPTTPLSNIPTNLINAVIAAEDHSFAQNPGIDIKAMLRAGLSVTAGRHEGASTITQQLAKTVFLDHNTSTWDRKKKQIILAVRITRSMTKSRIMETYLNVIPWGRGTTGITEAASRYYNKKPAYLTLSQCALLAGIIQSPTALDPTRHPEKSLRRRNHILDEMLQMRTISKQDYLQAKKDPLNITPGLLVPRDTEHPTTIPPYEWISDMIQSNRSGQIRTTIDSRHQKEITEIFALGLMRYDVLTRGLKIIVGHEPCENPMPAIAQSIINQTPEWTRPWRYCHGALQSGRETQTPRIESLAWSGRLLKHTPFSEGDIVFGGSVSPDKPFRIVQPTSLNGSAIMVNGETGDITALTGGLRWSHGAFNRATLANRQPGSTIKPFVYLSAIEHGWRADDNLFDIPITIQTGNTTWSPTNDNGDVAGKIKMSRALAESRNLATVNLASAIGFDEATKHIISTGISSSPLQPSAVLGTAETTTFKMAQATTLIANNGILTPLHLTQTPTAPPRRETTAEATEELLKIMHATLENGGTMSREKQTSDALLRKGYATGGKTGTTTNFTDAWTLAIAKPWIVVVQVGKDTPEKIRENAFASDLAAPIAMEILKQTLLQKEPAQ